MKMNKNLFIAPFLVLPLIASCGNKSKEWKEITRAEAIRIEANILSNFKTPKFYTSVVEFKENDEIAYRTDNLGEGYSESQKFYRSIDLYSSPEEDVSWYAMVDYYRVVENELWNLRAYKYNLEKPEEQKRSKEKIKTENPMDDLRNAVFMNYYEYILNFENIVEEISQGKTDGEFSFYSYDKDDTSLKGIVKFNKSQANDSTYDSEMQIAFENNLPSSFFVMEHVDGETEGSNDKHTGYINFDYSKEPYLPSDANPTDWCD